MKTIYILLFLSIACGKKNDFSNSKYISEASTRNESSGIIPKDALLWLSLKGGGTISVDWELQSSVRSILLDTIAANQSNTLLPERIDYYFDLSTQKGVWENILNENPFEKMQLELNPANSTNPGIDLGWTQNGQQVLSRFIPLRNNELLEGKASVFSIGGDRLHDEQMRTKYRLILSMPEGDEVYYISPEVSLKSFLENHQLEVGQKNTISSLRELAGNWHTLNLEDGVKSIPAAGKSYAVVYADESQLRIKNNYLMRETQNLMNNPKFLFPKNSGKSVLTFFFPPYNYLETKREADGVGATRPVFGNSYQCTYPIVSALGLKEMSSNSSQEVLSFVMAVPGTPMSQWSGARILWEVVGISGTAVQLEIDNSLNIEGIGWSSKVSEMVTTGSLNGGRCQTANGPERQNHYLRQDVKMAAFLTQKSNY